MDLKNLRDQVVTPVNPTTTGELPAPEFAQLSEEDLLQIIGGANQGFEGSIFGPVPVDVEVKVGDEIIVLRKFETTRLVFSLEDLK